LCIEQKKRANAENVFRVFLKTDVMALTSFCHWTAVYSVTTLGQGAGDAHKCPIRLSVPYVLVAAKPVFLHSPYPVWWSSQRPSCGDHRE